MRLEIDVPLLAWGRAKPTHTYKNVFASIQHVFELPEYSASEVPLVMSFSETEEDSTQRYEYFGFEGQLYTNQGARADDERAKALFFHKHDHSFTHPFFSDYVETMQSRIDYIRRDSPALAKHKILPTTFADIFENPQKTPYRFEELASLGLRLDDDTVVEAAIERFSKHLQRFIVVGGNVMLREQEPLIEVRSEDYRNTIRSSMRIRSKPSPLLNVKSSFEKQIAFFSLKDHDQLADRMDALAARFGRSGPSMIQGTEIFDVEIYDPRYVNGSSEGATLVAAAANMKTAFLDNISNHSHTDDAERVRAKTEAMLLSLNPSDVALMQRLIVALAEPDEAAVPELVEPVISEVVQLYATGRTDQFFGKRAFIEHAADALERWYDREVGFNLAMTPTTAFRG